MRFALKNMLLPFYSLFYETVEQQSYHIVERVPYFYPDSYCLLNLIAVTMKLRQPIFIIALLFCSCGLSEREKAIKERETVLNEKQQTLLLLEQQLTQKEKLLQEREYKLDSTKREMDSVVIHGPSIVGKWQVKMQCVETSCSGSAIGDVKTEQWEFTSSGNDIVMKAYVGKNLTRIYNGNYTQRGLQLTDNNTPGAAKIEVTLRILNEKKLDGIREIVLTDCKTTYSITADRL